MPLRACARWHGLAIALILGLATLALHHAALRAGWTFDDPVHLRFAVEHSPWQYFTQRDVMLRQSYAHITPWNAFFYDLGLPWAGLDARWHHAHLLAVIWATALATWALLRRWLPPVAALAGALLFLAMVPTKVVGLTISTGHYAYGLLFSVLALHAWARALAAAPSACPRNPPAVQPGAAWAWAWAWAAAAAGLYALACLCKELYAPLPAVLLFFPAARPVGWRRRVTLFVPVLLVAAAYALMRLWLFGGSGVGGYAALSVREAPNGAELAIRLLRGLHQMLFGIGPTAWVALALAAFVLLGAALGAPRRPRAGGVLFLSACVLALAPPVIAYAAVQLWLGDHRIVLPLAWALAVALAWQAGRAARPSIRRATYAALGLLGALLVFGQYQVDFYFNQVSAAKAAQHQFIIDSGPADVLVPHDFEQVGYLRDLAQAAATWDGRPRATVVADEEALEALGAERGAAAQAWHPACHCMRPLGGDYSQRITDWRQRLQAGQGRPWHLALRTSRTGSSRVLVQWQARGASAAGAEAPLQLLHIDIEGVGRLGVPPLGENAFGIDNTFPLWSRQATVRVIAQAADGAWLRSPALSLPLDRDASIQWPALAAGNAVPR